jgi:threonine/homoserine/homoserine lactone efflux protein
VLPGFALTATLLIMAPGPDSVLIIRNTVRGGRRAGWITACGTLSGLLIWATAAALGLSVLVTASRVGYAILRLAGAGYLAWLGLTSLRLIRRGTGPGSNAGGRPSPQPETQHPKRGRLYVNGLASNLLNPKIGVFFIAFLPGFIPARSPVTALSFALGLWFVVETGMWLGTLSWLASRGAQWLHRPSAQRWLEHATGLALLAFAVRVAVDSR